MPKRNYTPEQIINSLREAEVLISKGSTADFTLIKNFLPGKIITLKEVYLRLKSYNKA